MTSIQALLQFTPNLPVEALCAELAEADTITALGRRKVARCLFDMHQRDLYTDTGHKSAVHYARAVRKMSKRSAQTYLQAGKHLSKLPILDNAVVTGDLSWSKLRCLIRVTVPETQTAWLERAEELNAERLSLDVARCERGDMPKQMNDGGLPEIRMNVIGKLILTEFQLWELARRKLSAECSQHISTEDMMGQLSRMVLSTDVEGKIEGRTKVKHSPYQLIIHQDAAGTRVHTDNVEVTLNDEQVQKLASQAELVPASRQVKDPNGETPAWLRRRVLARDNNSCRHCGDSRYVQVHHVDHRDQGGQTAEAVLASLCSTCHSMIHSGLLQLRGNAKDGFVFLDSKGAPVDQVEKGLTFPVQLQPGFR